MNQIEYLFNEPKWQAKLVDPNSHFVCQDGAHITSLFEMRQVLLNCSDEVYNSMVSDSYNYLSSWVADAILDPSLAAEIHAYTNRYELVSALENYMLRTVALPDYLARRWYEFALNPFITQKGTQITNLKQAYEVLSNPENDLTLHLRTNKQDFADWVRFSVGDYMLADLVQDAENFEKATQIISNHILMLKSSLHTCHCGSDSCTCAN